MDPPKYVAYPREGQSSTYGSIEKMEVLGKGYYGLTTVAAVSIAVYLWGIAMVFGGGRPTLIFVILEFLVTFGLMYGVCERIGEGMGWHASKARKLAFFLALNSLFFAGIIGLYILERIVRKELMRYGARSRALGIVKADFRAGLAKRRRGEEVPTFLVEPPSAG